MTSTHLAWFWTPLAALATACGTTAADSGAALPDGGAGGDRPECLTSSECPTGWTCSEFGTCVPPGSGTDGGAGPAEVEFEFSTPRSSLRYLYVAMPELDALAKIDGRTFEVGSVDVGEQPRVVAAAPGTDTAAVLDSENGTATIVRPTSEADAKTVVRTLPNLNQLAWDPTGRYAVAWFDLAAAVEEAGGIDLVGEIGSFQDVSVIALGRGGEPDRAIDLTVGFQPREVEFDEGGRFAYVITDDGISVLDLEQVVADGPGIVAPIPISDDPFADPEDFEVNVVASGEYAVVRESGRAAVTLVSLLGEGAGERRTVTLPAAPSDVDLGPDGSRAYAVVRDTAELAVIDIPEDAGDPDGVELVALDPAHPAGSLELSPNGTRGLLYTNAEAREEVTVIDLTAAPYDHRAYPLKKSVRAVAFAPGGDTALVIHARAPGDPSDATDPEEVIDRSHGYALLDVDTGFAKLERTPVDPGSFAFARDRDVAYLTLDGGDDEAAVAEVHTIDLASFVIRRQALGSPPEAVGVLSGAGTVFVSQRHPLGRVSFLSTGGGDMRTVTGFDLNGRIVD